jgi:hypothetical protein
MGGGESVRVIVALNATASAERVFVEFAGLLMFA